MKKITLFGFITLLLFSLTACISTEEREKGKEDLKKGEKLIREYVRETYGRKAKASDFKTCYAYERYDSTVPNFDKVASGFVKATVSTDDNEFDIIYNVHTDEVLTKENISAVMDSFLEYGKEKVKAAEFVDCKMELHSRKYEDTYISSFLMPGIKTYKELLESGEYSIRLTYRSIDSDYDGIKKEEWENVIASFQNTESHVMMLFVNFKEKEGFQTDTIYDYFDEIDYDTSIDGSVLEYSISERALKNAKNIIYANNSGDVMELKEKVEDE